MAVIFEPSAGFEKVDEFYKRLARIYLTDRKFGSLGEALRQSIHILGEEVPLSRYFKVDRKTVVPEGLPHTIREADIVGICMDDEGVFLHNQPGINVPILTARYVD